MPASTNSKRVNIVLVAIYGVFALAATARALFQIFTKFSDAPVAYALSALAGLVYIVATAALVTGNHQLAKATIWFELAGVLVVGILSLVHPDVFKHPSVWSDFGIGYGLVPLALPIWGLLWLYRAGK